MHWDHCTGRVELAGVCVIYLSRSLVCVLQVPERYFQMLLAVHRLQNETFQNGWLTWVDWSKTNPSGAHPQDMEASNVDEELLFQMRTGRMGVTQYKCRAAWDSASLTSAQGLLQSYVSNAHGWQASQDVGASGTGAKTFKSLEHECLLFGRKFKSHTQGAVLDVLEDPHYTSWNYTKERLLPYLRNSPM